jgi:hypothetical protein
MAKKPKADVERRRPTLADRFAVHHYDTKSRFVLPAAIKQMQNATRNARRFVFDEDAARRVARVVQEVPDLLAREVQFARAPYDITWIEFPSYIYWLTLREENPRLYDAQGEWGDVETADHTIGYLIDHNRINTVTLGTVSEPDGPPYITPIQYRLNTEWPVEDQLQFAQLIGASRLGIDAFLWGSTYDKLSWEERRLLRDYNMVERVPLNPYNRISELWSQPGSLAGVARGSVGELRTVIAMLLMLNRPSLTTYRQTLPTRKLPYHGRNIPYMSHTVVDVTLDPVPTLRLIGTPEGESVARRRHEVRGHYCHDKTARDYAKIAGCIHEWIATNEDWTPVDATYPRDEVKHWRCSVCEGKRWWRDAHERGTAEVGFVAHDGYDVTDRSE